MISKMKLLLACVISVLISGCASGPTGQSFTSFKVNPPAKDEAQLIIYQTKFWGMPRAPMVKINGIEKCELPPNGFFSEKIKANKDILVTAKVWDDFSPSELKFRPQAHQTYYIQLELDNSVNPGMLFGAVGGAIGGAMTAKDEPSHAGLFSIRKVEKDFAQYQLREAKEVTSCRSNNE